MNWIEKFLGFKLDVKYFYSIIKDNIALIVVIPSVLGGLEQLLRLFTIQPEMVRFFSVSQVIPDGLAIILMSALLFIVFYIWFRFFYMLLLLCEKFKVYSAGMFFISLSIFLLLIGIEDYILDNYVFINAFRNLEKEFNLINIFFALLASPILLMVLYFLFGITQRNPNFHFLFGNKNIIKVVCLFLITTVLVFPPIYNYDYLLNFSLLKSDIKETFKDLKELESINIKYVNDKYVIVELKSKDYCNCGKAYLYKVYLLDDIIKGDFNK
ncbi:hypothetical protein SAMN05421786_106132 [Chryseobacterium ureilyticum]|uniref:Uncharacterized protein n=1 Tax=Chryseobacterium ureilyticum TaxID=373668 RepID=A0A1N7PRZ3_9FLAO|nr:hypothetical protein [Chryseobacterium ureilyticum]SIT13336.1 hypothetical protein SAMN05421786_106132 [Chryseobacterium ureilyticum]